MSESKIQPLNLEAEYYRVTGATSGSFQSFGELKLIQDKINEVVRVSNELVHQAELGHFHKIDDPFMTSEEEAYGEPDNEQEGD